MFILLNAVNSADFGLIFNVKLYILIKEDMEKHFKTNVNVNMMFRLIPVAIIKSANY